MGAPDFTTPPLREATTAILEMDVLDPDGVAIPGSALDAVLLTLYDEETTTIINARDHEDITNHVDENGHLTIELDAVDQAIQDKTLAHEYHRALLQWTWTLAGSPATQRSGNFEIRIIVRNISNLPTFGSP